MKPLCAKCKREVDTLLVMHDDFMQRIVFTAKCHGATDSVSVPYSAEPVDITYGTAFQEEGLCSTS